MKQQKEYVQTSETTITMTVGSDDDWTCLCGNRPWEDGFYPVNEAGEEVEPTPEDWTTNEYVCAGVIGLL